MTRSLFAGPSLVRARLSEPGLQVHPPIQAGDVEALLCEALRPTAILIIDGVFGAGQAISLGELRRATEHGVAVFGATSLGALRAAEGERAGVRALGAIAAEYVAGTRTNDADVALLHTGDGRATTAPLVNVEHLARMLVLLGADRAKAARFVRSCRRTHFTRRTFTAVEELAGVAGLTSDPRCLNIVRQPHLWDRKALDALAAVEEFMRLSDEDMGRMGLGSATLCDLIPDRIMVEQKSR